MKCKYMIYVLCLTVLVPALIVSLTLRGYTRQDIPQTPTAEAEKEKESVYVTVLMNDTVKSMELETYITGVVLAEMPATFHTEALKAQSVVARTFTLKRATSAAKHRDADVCTDYTCCQAYCSAEEYLGKGGTQSDLNKILDAVLSTQGQVLLFQGEFIEATYFSCSGGRTEDAVAVWGSDIPYLRAVDSPGEEAASHYTDTVSFSLQEFCHLLDLPNEQVSIGKITYTEGEGVDTIELNESTYKGTTIRSRLGLRSTAFVITVVGKNVIITTKGFGHRVGMSQYGADAMAEQGSSYGEILTHYYTGTELGNHKP